MLKNVLKDGEKNTEATERLAVIESKQALR